MFLVPLFPVASCSISFCCSSQSASLQITTERLGLCWEWCIASAIDFWPTRKVCFFSPQYLPLYAEAFVSFSASLCIREYVHASVCVLVCVPVASLGQRFQLYFSFNKSFLALQFLQAAQAAWTWSIYVTIYKDIETDSLQGCTENVKHSAMEIYSRQQEQPQMS